MSDILTQCDTILSSETRSLRNTANGDATKPLLPLRDGCEEEAQCDQPSGQSARFADEILLTAISHDYGDRSTAPRRFSLFMSSSKV